MNNSGVGKVFKREQVLFIAILALLVVVIMLFSFRAFGSGNNNTDFQKRFTTFSDDWTVTVDGNSSTVTFPALLTSGDDSLIVLSKTLPESIPEYSALAMRNYHLVIYARVNGELIYTYPNNPSDDFTLLSDAWSIIELKPEYAGATLELTLKTLSFRKFSDYIYDFYLGDSNSIIKHISDLSSFPFMTGIILLTIGAFIIGLSLLFGKHTDQSPNIPLGLALMLFSVWMMNRSRPAMFSGSNGRIFLISLTSMLLVAPFLFLFVSRRSEKLRKLSYIGFIASFLFGIFVIGARSLVRFDAEIVTTVAYAFGFTALIFNLVFLHDRSFGKPSMQIPKEERNLNIIEFSTLVLFVITALVGFITNTKQLRTDINIPMRVLLIVYSLAYLGIILWRVYIAAREREVVAHKLQESQLELMMGQIQPHYMFNTISSIRTMVKVDPDTAYNMLYDFAKYLRANVDNTTNLGGIKIADEVENIKSYANIELVRFADRLDIDYVIESGDFLVPALSIQPIVENAIKHGVTKKPSGGTITLRTYEDADNYVVEVKDDGIGIGPAAACKLFRAAKDTGYEENHSKRLAQEAMKSIIDDVHLLDEDGERIDLRELLDTYKPVEEEIKEKHKSAGMSNIIMRLREMAEAKIEISSQVNVGTTVKVSFPKDSEFQKPQEEKEE